MLNKQFRTLEERKDELKSKIEEFSDANAVIDLEAQLRDVKNLKAQLLKRKTELEVESQRVEKDEPESYDHYIGKIKVLKLKKEKLQGEIGMISSFCVQNSHFA